MGLKEDFKGGKEIEICNIIISNILKRLRGGRKSSEKN